MGGCRCGTRELGAEGCNGNALAREHCQADRSTYKRDEASKTLEAVLVSHSPAVVARLYLSLEGDDDSRSTSAYRSHRTRCEAAETTALIFGEIDVETQDVCHHLFPSPSASLQRPSLFPSLQRTFCPPAKAQPPHSWMHSAQLHLPLLMIQSIAPHSTGLTAASVSHADLMASCADSKTATPNKWN